MVGKIITHKVKRALHGWFAVGGQSGNYRLAERLVGLEPLRDAARGATILDLGCAEGLIGLYLLKNGPGALLHGVDRHGVFIVMARLLTSKMRAKPNARFFKFDLNDLADWMDFNPGALLPTYDIVLCLCIAHKLKNPELFLRTVTSMCGKYFALQLPSPIINDRRSDYWELDTHALLVGALGFALLHEEDNPAKPLSRRIYQRCT